MTLDWRPDQAGRSSSSTSKYSQTSLSTPPLGKRLKGDYVDHSSALKLYGVKEGDLRLSS